jgi:hypothetical protein
MSNLTPVLNDLSLIWNFEKYTYICDRLPDQFSLTQELI